MDTPGRHATVRSLFDSLYRPQQLRFNPPKTIYKYRLELKRFDRFLARSALVTDLTDVVVGDAAEWVLSAEARNHEDTPGLGLSVESTRGFVGRICKVWDFLARKHIDGVVEFPTLENMRKQKRIPVAWTREELALLWAVLLKQPGDIGCLLASDWWCSMICVMWRTSERIGALLTVRWSDIDLVGGFLTIPGERRKGGRQGRVYRLKPDAIQWLMRIREPGRELVWPLPFEYRHLWPRFKEILRCAGLPFGRERMFGCVRKSHASHLEAAGGDATASLGHSDRQTTVDYYLDEKITRADVSSWPADRLFGLGENPMRPAG